MRFLLNSLARHLIEDYLLYEVRVRNPVTKEEMVARLERFYGDSTNRTPPADFISRATKTWVKETPSEFIELTMKLPDDLLPGIEVPSSQHGGLVITTDFEKDFLRGTGWRISSTTLTSGNSALVLALESRGKSGLKKPQYLYHATPLKYERQVLKEGLKPRSRSYDNLYRYSESRIYFTTLPDEETLKAAISDRGTVNEFVIFVVDTKKFNKFNIHTDWSYGGFEGLPRSVYTLTHIPPSALKVYKRVTE